MNHKQFICDDLIPSPSTDQGFQAKRYSKAYLLNIPDTIPENSSGEISRDSSKMEATKITVKSFNYEDKENISDNLQVMCNEFPNVGSNHDSIDNSYIKECEKKVLEGISNEEKYTDLDKSAVSNRSLKFLRNLCSNDTVSTPPSMLRKEISILRNEMAEVHEFHDLEIQLLKEEKLEKKDDPKNYVELFEKYSALMELYSTLKTEYEEYRKEQEKVTYELQSKTADCLESLCSQIETSDNSLNFSSLSFASFTGGIRSSTMMGDMSEIEATVVHDATVLGNDPLSITTDGEIKTPFLSAKKLFPQEQNSTLRKPVVKDIKEIIANRDASILLDSEYNMKLMNLETDLYEKVKEVENLEQRLFKVEDLSVVLQNELERITSVYSNENKILKENLVKKTEQFNELNEKLFTEIVSLNPSLRNSLVDVPGTKLLVVFMETIMESCKKIQQEQLMKHNEEKAELQARIENLQSELENFRKSRLDLEKKLSDVENTILTRDEEIHMLQSHLSSLRQTQEDFAAARVAMSELESRLTLTEAEKIAAENRFRELESIVENLKREMQLELQAKTTHFENKNSQLNEFWESLKAEIKSNESIMATIRKKLTSAEETILQLQAKIQLHEAEKSELEEVNKNLKDELIKASKLEENPFYEGIQIEVESLKQQISDFEKTIEKLKKELETSQLRDASKIESLQMENSCLTSALDKIEDTQNDLLNRLTNGNEIFYERVSKLIENSQLSRENKIISVFSQIITEFQTILTKKFNFELGTHLNHINSLQDEITEKEEVIKSLRYEIEKSEKVIAECNEEIKVLKSQEAALKQTKDDLNEIQVLQSNLKQSQDDLTDIRNTLSGLVFQLSASEAEKAETEKRYRELEGIVEGLKREIEEKEHLKTHLSSTEELKMKIENDNTRLRELCDALRAEITESKNLISQREEEIKILQSNDTELKSILEAKMSEAIAREEEIRVLRSEMIKTQETLSGELTIEKTEAGKRYKELEDIIENLKREIDVMGNIREELNAQKLENDVLKDKITEAENLIITQNKEIQILKSTEGELRKTLSLAENSIFAKEERIQILQSDVKQTQETLRNQKTETENRYQELKNIIENLKREISEMENIREELKVQKLENAHLKNKITEVENAIVTRDEEIRTLKLYELELTTFKQNLLSADETIQKLQSQLRSVEVEKFQMENRCTELQESNQNLRVEVTAARNNPEYEKIQTENDDLKQRIFESEKLMAELKNELELAKKDQMNNICKVEELIREIEELKKENSGFSHALVTIEETQRNLADVLSDFTSDCDLPGDRITKAIEKTSKLTDIRETKIVSDFVETITKTCKGVQNELIKKFDNKKLEWETQRDVDLRDLRDRINFLTEKNCQLEVIIKQTKEDLAAADETIFKLKSQLSSVETEKLEIELRCRKLQEKAESLQAEIDTKETIIKGLDELKFVREKIETENEILKERILKSEEMIIQMKKLLEDAREEQNTKDVKIQKLLEEIESLKSERQGLNKLSEKLLNLEKSNQNLLNVVSDVQLHLDIPKDALTKLLSGNLENKKILSEKINMFAETQMEGLKAENRSLKIGNENLKGKVKQLVKLIGESASSELKEEISNLNISQSNSIDLRSKSGRNIDLCVRRLDKLEEINHNLTELLTQVLTMTEFQDLEKLTFCSVRNFPNITKKVVAHINALQSRMKELKDENSQLDEECETYAKIIKDLKKEAAVVWKSNKEKTEALEAEINRLKEEKGHLETQKEDLLGNLSKLTSKYQKLKSASEVEGTLHTCICGSESKKINELKRIILVKEQKILELQDLEIKSTSFKTQIEYLKTALEREKKKAGEEKEKNKKLQNELNEVKKNQKTDTKDKDENQMLDELRMRGSVSGGIVQEFVDKEKMRKLSKDIGILKELCRARYAEIKRLEAVNAALRNTPKNSNQMDSPIRSRGYNTRSKNQARDLWRTEIIGKENSAS